MPVSPTEWSAATAQQLLTRYGVLTREATHRGARMRLAKARLVDGRARAVRKEWEAHEETKQQAHGVIEKARFAIEGPTRSSAS